MSSTASHCKIQSSLAGKLQTRAHITAAQDRTGQDKTDRTGQDRTGNGRQQQHRTGQDRAGQNRSQPNRMEQKQDSINSDAAVVQLLWAIISHYHYCRPAWKQTEYQGAWQTLLGQLYIYSLHIYNHSHKSTALQCRYSRSPTIDTVNTIVTATPLKLLVQLDCWTTPNSSTVLKLLVQLYRSTATALQLLVGVYTSRDCFLLKRCTDLRTWRWSSRGYC